MKKVEVGMREKIHTTSNLIIQYMIAALAGDSYVKYAGEESTRHASLVLRNLWYVWEDKS